MERSGEGRGLLLAYQDVRHEYAYVGKRRLIRLQCMLNADKEISHTLIKGEFSDIS